MTIKEINETPIEDIYPVARFLYNLSSHNYEIALKEEAKVKEYLKKIVKVIKFLEDDKNWEDDTDQARNKAIQMLNASDSKK